MVAFIYPQGPFPMYNTFNYDPAAYETASFIPKGLREWKRGELIRHVNERLEKEKSLKELHVYFYRVGHRVAYPLPVTHLPDLPEGIPGLGFPYPWSIWLAWELRERWEIFYHAWNTLGDKPAGLLLQQELAALDSWDKSFEGPGTAHLCTGHLASLLALYLKNAAGWETDLFQKARQAAFKLIDRDIQPWYAETWQTKETFNLNDLHNIPCIILTNAASLARVLHHPLSTELNSKAESLFQAWLQFKEENYSEGTSYDAFFLDSLCLWIDNHPDKETLLAQGKNTFEKILRNWIHHTLPGRLDLHAPLGDVEPEMFFWMNVTEKWVQWYGWPEGAWAIKHIPPVRLPSSALVNSMETVYGEKQTSQSPEAGCREHAASATLRTGWDSTDLAVYTGLSRTPTGHLHYDNGQIIIGAYNRFWITDPGYQQYRPGPECDFTLGIQAHNVPVINGQKQSKRQGELLQLKEFEKGIQYGCLDISECYENLPAHSSVTRAVWLIKDKNKTVLVQDKITSTEDLKIDYYWQGGTHLAWAFKNNQARLSDGEHALWISTSAGPIRPEQVEKHTGSRGPLTLRHSCQTQNHQGIFNWIFYFDEYINWEPPDSNIKKLMEMTKNLADVK